MRAHLPDNSSHLRMWHASKRRVSLCVCMSVCVYALQLHRARADRGNSEVLDISIVYTRLSAHAGRIFKQTKCASEKSCKTSDEDKTNTHTLIHTKPSMRTTVRICESTCDNREYVYAKCAHTQAQRNVRAVCGLVFVGLASA